MKLTKPEAILFVILGVIQLAAIVSPKFLHRPLTAMDVVVAVLPMFVLSIVVGLRMAARTKRALRSLAAELGRNPFVSVSMISGGVSVRFDRDGTTFEGD